jgi:hypothetical protein
MKTLFLDMNEVGRKERKTPPWNLFTLTYTTTRQPQQKFCAKNLLLERLRLHLFRNLGFKGAK